MTPARGDHRVDGARSRWRWSRIALVLSAVFLPMVFFGGSTGVIYRQFSATIVSAMALSVFIALTLSPAIAANLLKRNHATVEETWLGRKAPARRRTRSSAAGSSSTTSFDRLVALVRRHGRPRGRPQMAVPRRSTAASARCSIILFFRLPTGFLPTEDQGAALVQFRLPAGATMTRTSEVQRAVENYFLHGPEKKNVKTYFTVAGGGQGAAGQNTGQAFINLADYDQRTAARIIAPTRSSSARRARSAACATRRCSHSVPGAIRGLGQSSGFTMELQNTGGMSARGVRRSARQAARRGIGRTDAARRSA